MGDLASKFKYSRKSFCKGRARVFLKQHGVLFSPCEMSERIRKARAVTENGVLLAPFEKEYQHLRAVSPAHRTVLKDNKCEVSDVCPAGANWGAQRRETLLAPLFRIPARPSPKGVRELFLFCEKIFAKKSSRIP